MHIALDATYSVGRELTGVGVYSREILHGLPALHPDARFTFCYRPNRFLRSFRESIPRATRRRPLFESGPPRNADVFHALNQRVPATKHRRTVTTFHDLFVLTGEYSTKEFRDRFADQARHAAERSDAIVCVSQFTADQVESLLNVERARLHVVHHGVRGPAEQPSKQGREKMVLSVGSIQKRKNTARLVEAFELSPPGWKLILAGAAGFEAESILQRIAESPRREDISVTGYINRSELEHLYSKASLFAFPSLDEGFGIPVIEAMAWGVPVITSDRSALAEVSGEAALHVDPENIEELATALQTTMENSGLRNELAARGLEWSAKFTWQSAVEKTWNVYRHLLPSSALR
ncbi:MAG: glycosyltransferase family 4 protein [Acidobacteria bacterium]|nr:glycosyltransferase family 4 protein [Acidobacteriota bacterium]